MAEALDWTKLAAELGKPLDPSAIKPPPAGKYGEYVDGYHVLTEANRIFGHGGWSYDVTRLEQASGQVFELPGKGPQYRCSYLCTVRVRIGNVTREGAAVGTGSGKPENMGDVIESAVKEAETDALKRALRSFGNTFGLALYEKDKAKRQVASGGEIDAALAAIAAAETGRDLLGVVNGIGQLNSLDAIRKARVEKLRAIVKAAPTSEAIAKLQQVFGPDWPEVGADAAARAQEIQGAQHAPA